MTLSRRALLLIFPVVLAGYVLAALLVYFAETSAIGRLEATRLQQRAVNLANLFRSDLALNRSQIAAITGTEALRLFLVEMDNGYRAGAVTLRLREGMRNVWEDPQTFVSLAIFRPDGHLEYYYENSPDPFATAAPSQIEVVERLLKSDKTSSWDFVDRNGERPLIIHSELVDTRTMTRPRAAQRKDSALIQVAVRPDHFIEMRKEMEAEYGAIAAFSTTPLKPDQNQVSAELGPSLFLSLHVPAAYVSGLTLRLKLFLATGTLLISLMSVGLLIGLVQRFITDPVSKLDRQVTDVIAGRKATIALSAEAGEIGRLSVNIKRLHDELRHSVLESRRSALADPLTGLGNRLAFNDAVAAAIAAAEAASGICTMLFFDVDNFKFVNDRYGHKAGDELLKTVARRVAAVIDEARNRYSDSSFEVMRLSGDEFAILVSSPGPSDAANSVATATLDIFKNGLEVSGVVHPVSVSIGLASYPHDALSAAELMHNADAAMYQAKGSGKNALSSFNTIVGNAQRRVRGIQDELRELPMDQEFSLVFMPIIDSLDVVRRCEALLRWHSPKFGDVGPDEFMPIAERSGSYGRIDRWVVERAIREYASLEGLFGEGVVLAINLSAAELRDGVISEHIARCLAESGVPASKIEIELTETFATGEYAAGGLCRLRNMGLRIAIDDFGAGHTSIRHFTDFDVDTIKLDRSLVARLAMLPDQGSTLSALIALCHARGLVVVAEGVDTPVTRDNLQAAGCDLLQGYGVSPPLSLADLGTWQINRLVAGMKREPQALQKHKAAARNGTARQSV